MPYDMTINAKGAGTKEVVYSVVPARANTPLGVDPRTIMETLGHSQISLTLNTYSHVLPTVKTDAAQRTNTTLSEGLR